MRKLMVGFVVVFIAFGAVGIAWADDIQKVSVPVAGAYVEPALGGPVAYVGTVTILWTSSTDGTGAPTLSHTSIFEAQAWRLSDRFPFRISGASGSLCQISDDGSVNVSVPFRVTNASGRDVTMSEGELRLVFLMPRDGNPTKVSRFAVASQ